MMDKVNNSSSNQVGLETPKARKGAKAAKGEEGTNEPAATEAAFSVQLSKAQGSQNSVADKGQDTAKVASDEQKAPNSAQVEAQAPAQAPTPVQVQTTLPASSQGSLQGKESASTTTLDSSRSESLQPGENGTRALAERARTSELRPAAERMPLTQKAAVSLNTGAAIAGPKVWSKEWIFQGEDANPNLKPLIDDGSAPATKPVNPNIKRSLFGEEPSASEAERAKMIQALAQLTGGIAGTTQAQVPSQALANQTKAGKAMAQAQLQPQANAAEVAASQSQGSDVATAAASASGAAQVIDLEGGDEIEILDVKAYQEAEAAKAGGKGSPSPALSASNANRPKAYSGSDFVDTLSQVRGPAAASAPKGAVAAAPKGASANAGFTAAAMSPFGFATLKGRDSAGLEEPYAAGTRSQLRVLEGGADKESIGLKGKRSPFAVESGLAGAAVGGQLGAAQAQADLQSAIAGDKGQAKPKVEVNALVTKGAMARDRLSSEALLGVGTGVKALSAHGGGEMRIRLKPDSLGELNVKVVTSGNQVKLQIQATDERARKILEDSVNHLKDSLSAQNLSLAKLEVSVTQPQNGQGTENEGRKQDSPNQQSAGYQDLLNSRQQQGSAGYGNGGGRSDAYANMIDLDPIVQIRRGGATAEAASTSAAAMSGRSGGARLDVMA